MSSNFRSPDPFSGFWSYRDGRVDNICATTGAEFIRHLRSVLGLPPNAVWDADLQNALIRQITAFNSANPNSGWATPLAQIQADAAAQRVGGMSLVFAIYLTYYAQNRRRLDAIFLPSDTIMPLWGVASPEESAPNAGLVCWIPATDPPASSLNRTNLAQAIAESATGVRVGPGRPAPLGPTVTPPGVSGGIGLLPVLGIGAALIGIGYLLSRNHS